MPPPTPTSALSLSRCRIPNTSTSTTKAPNETSSPTVLPVSSTPQDPHSGARSSTPLPSSKPRNQSPAGRQKHPPTTFRSIPSHLHLHPPRTRRPSCRKPRRGGPWSVRTRLLGLPRLPFARLRLRPRHLRGESSSTNNSSNSAGRVTARRFVVYPCGSRRYRPDVRIRSFMHFAGQAPYIESPDWFATSNSRSGGGEVEGEGRQGSVQEQGHEGVIKGVRDFWGVKHGGV